MKLCTNDLEKSESLLDSPGEEDGREKTAPISKCLEKNCGEPAEFATVCKKHYIETCARMISQYYENKRRKSHA